MMVETLTAGDMASETLNAAEHAKLKALPRPRLVAFGSGFEPFFGLIARAAALLVVLVMAGIFVILCYQSFPAFKTFGLSFIFSSSWNPVTDKFGSLPAVTGTLITSIVAVAIGAPLALGVAFYLNELCPFRLRSVLTTTIELLAAIPSIIYGMWGLFVLVPIMSKVIQPAVINALGPIPIIGALFAGPPFGIGMLTAGLILSIMVLPFIASVSLQAFATVPVPLREAAYGTGASVWEVCYRIILPYTKTGIIGAIMLGLGRALGETMAVTFVIGNAHRIQLSLFAPGTTISATLANEFTEAFGKMYLSSLLALGLILFAITFVVLVITRILLHSVNRKIPV